MKAVYPEFSGQVALYAVGSNPVESLTLLESFGEAEGYTWPVAVPEGNLLKDLKVIQRSTKIAFDADGIITYRGRFGQGDPEEWRQVMQELVDSQ